MWYNDAMMKEMRKYFKPERCCFCGQFISFKKRIIRWTPFGGPLDLDPPDEEFAHKKCWNKNKDSHELIRRISYIKPS